MEKSRQNRTKQALYKQTEFNIAVSSINLEALYSSALKQVDNQDAINEILYAH